MITGDEEKDLSFREAYISMYKFLEKHYERTKHDEIGHILSAMSLLCDDSSADPAMKQEWMEVAKSVLHGNDDIYLKLSKDKSEGSK